MPEGMAWDAIPEALLVDCAQLVKANSIEGMCGMIVVGSAEAELTGPGRRQQEG